ncbi:MAG: hypothetical protein A2086_03750 [Spirochaetes bacterium GWD1_27_9]|nr:MAG: hypothetical protein A2086_03750 [Spirochaetes bacterium GWD1_27_9]
MVDKITLEIKKFLIDKFSNENDFDNLCRELEISNVYFGDYSTRITDLIHEIERNFPEFTNLYKALIKLKQNFKTQIDKLFELRDMDINPPIVTEIDKDNNYPYIHILGSITDNLPNIENDVAAKIGEKLALNDYYLITSCRKKGIDKIISNSFRNTMITNKKWDINNINNAILQNLYNEDALFNDAIKITSNTEFESYKNCLSNASAIIIIGTRKRGLDYFNFMKDNAKYNKPFFPISLNHITNKNENSDTLYSIIISNWEEYKKFYQGIDINDFKKLQFKDDINSDDIVETIINLINIVVKKKETILDSEKRPRYISDSPLGEDFLNRNKETIAFSRLVSSRDLVPPLSIGLFGNWGSGKSFFMNKMKEEIKRLSNQAQSIIYKIDKNKFEDEILNKLQNDDKNLFENYKINEEENIYELNNNIDDKIINKIIQKLYLIDYVSKQTAYCMNISLIEFNAWHYIDTNLWASLVCHIFEELATQLKILTNDEKKEKELYDNLETVKRIKLEAEEERKIAESKLTDIQKKITENKVNIMIQSLIESTLTDKKVIKELSNLKDEIINSDINQKVKSIISDIKEY